MSYHMNGLGFALNEKVVPVKTKGIVLAKSLSTSNDAPSLEEQSCMEFQRMAAEAGLYDGPIDGDCYRVADLRNMVRTEWGFPLIGGNISITDEDFAALKQEINAMQHGESFNKVPASETEGTGVVALPVATSAAPAKVNPLVPLSIVGALLYFLM